MNTEHATPELLAALAKAQGEIENATKNAQNPHFRNNYADLAEVLNTIRPVFAEHGLSIMQSPSFDGALCSVTTLIGHTGGGYITAMASCVPGKSDAQGIGSATTYLRRYSAAGLSGIAQEDDDGQSAAHDKKPGKPATKPAPKPEPKPEPNRAAYTKYRTELIAEANEVMNFADEAAGVNWFNVLVKSACADMKVKAGDILQMPEEQFSELKDMTTAKAIEATNAAMESANA